MRILYCDENDELSAVEVDAATAVEQPDGTYAVVFYRDGNRAGFYTFYRTFDKEMAETIVTSIFDSGTLNLRDKQSIYYVPLDSILHTVKSVNRHEVRVPVVF